MTDSGGIIPHEAEFLLYRTEDGRARVEVRFDGEAAWLTQAAMAALFQTTPQTITRHVAAIDAEGALEEGAACTSYAKVQTEGARVPIVKGLYAAEFVAEDVPADGVEGDPPSTQRGIRD